MVDIKIIAKIKSLPGNNFEIVSGEFVSQPKVKLEPEMDASRTLFITEAKKSNILTPRGTLIIKTASKNCNKRPTPTVLRLIRFLSFDIRYEIPKIMIIPISPVNLDKISKLLFLYICQFIF